MLRAHTPHGSRRRAAFRATGKRRSEKVEPSLSQFQPSPPPPPSRNKADILLGAILRSSSKAPIDSTSEGSTDPDEAEASEKAPLLVEQIVVGKEWEQSHQLPSETKAKRRIDFSDGTENEADDEGENGAEDEDDEEEDCRDNHCPENDFGKKSDIIVNHNNNHVVLSEEEIDRSVVPSAKDQERFRRSLENAASMVFHSRTGLPLTSSPAPLRRGSCCFDFDSTLNSVSSKRRYVSTVLICSKNQSLVNNVYFLCSALFELNTPPSPGAVSLEEGDKEAEIICDNGEVVRRRSTSRTRPQSHALLGSFEESALNGRLEPVSTIHGFTAEIGASGSFCPKHRKLPVTVFFYTLGDNDKVSSPYLVSICLKHVFPIETLKINRSCFFSGSHKSR